MAIAVRDNTTFAVEIEDVEGTYKAPTEGTSFILTLSDGAEMSMEKETLERAVFNGSLGKTTPRTGTRTVSGSIPTEFKGVVTEGDAPEYDKLMRSALGSRRQGDAVLADNTDTAGPLSHTESRIYVGNADSDKYEVGDIVTVKVAGAYHTSPIVNVNDEANLAYIDLLVPAAAPFENGNVIAAFTRYSAAESGHPSLSISKYIEGERLEQASGCRVTSMSLENFSTGQLASWNFGFEGLDWDSSLTTQPFVAVYDASLPPIILNACVFQDGEKVDVNEISFSVENELGFVTSTCSPNGRISGRPTERTVTGSFTPYKSDNDVTTMTQFKENTEFSMFGYAYIPGEAGEYSQVVAFYMPACIITEVSEGEQDGLLQEEVSFQAAKGSDTSQTELFISFN